MESPLTRAVHAIMLDAAARAVLPHYQHLAASDIHAKAADDAVTIADHESEAILAEALGRLLPEAAIVGEEAAFADPALLDRLGDALCWIIDPIDGTNNFAAGRPPFGILVALAQAGEAIGGWILDPLTGRFCSAELGQGAHIDGQPIRARTTGEAPSIAAISLLYADLARREAIKTHIAPHYQIVDIPRCAAEQYPRLVLGINDLSIFERTLAWDHAAGVLFLTEAGGKAARLDGATYRVDDTRKGMIAAANPALWEELAGRMAEVI
jgi:fructose-1,6-bisphosphatase/inositol monophosphatase family enzyme